MNKTKDLRTKNSHGLPFTAFARTNAVSINKDPMRVSIRNKLQCKVPLDVDFIQKQKLSRDGSPLPEQNQY